MEGNEPVDLARDVREPGRKAKQVIGVEVDLSFPNDLRSELREAINLLAGGSTDITVRKRYQRDPLTNFVEVEIATGAMGDGVKVLADDQRRFALRLLAALRFRYIPNHVHPTILLKLEEQSIRKMLFDRLGKSKTFGDEQIKRIQGTAAELMEPVRRELEAATGEVSAVELGTPESWKDLVWAFGLKLKGPQGVAYEATMHGSGIQSMLAYHVLHGLDGSFSGEFGWRKGAIWAVEEPESFLHASLQAALAQTLKDYAEGERLQILLTTHSPAFLGAAEEGFIVRMADSGQSQVERHPRERLIQAAQRSRITPYAHPLHLGALSPLLLVEGRHDRELITRAFNARSEPSPFEILALEDLESTLSGGVDSIRAYLHHNRSALAARPQVSPVIVVLDWEVNDKQVASIEKVLEPHPTSICVRMPVSLSNPDLSRQWVGIERFLSTGFIEDAATRFGMALTKPATAAAGSWKYGVQDLKGHKSSLHDLLEDRNQESDIGPLVAVADWLARELKSSQLSLV